MPRIAYLSRNFSDNSLAVIKRANAICAEYAAAGFDLTLRQLYYQFVARGLIPNRDTEYKKLGSIINDARLAGALDWNYITDRTRNLRSMPHWNDPTDIVNACASQFAVDRWKSQEFRPEVWIEKDALVGVITGVCQRNDVAFFSCRGYTSQSEVWGAGQRLVQYLDDGQTPVVIHLGDHDPSGIDMSRDITDRLKLFIEHHGYDFAGVRRIALNWDQVQQYTPPPNPAKLTDSRVQGYLERFGDESWELDALEPQVIADLIQETIDSVKDEADWNDTEKEQLGARRLIGRIVNNWPSVVELLNDIDPDPEDSDEEQ